MPEVVGLIKCPVCGAENQELRVNKKRKLYIYCDHGCATRFNSQTSREWLAKLAAGKSIFEQNFRILPIKPAGNDTQVFDNQTEKGGNIKNDGRDRIDGRTDAGFTGNAGNKPASRPSGRSWLAEWLADDDDE